LGQVLGQQKQQDKKQKYLEQALITRLKISFKITKADKTLN
jgi:hypothetical protein